MDREKAGSKALRRVFAAEEWRVLPARRGGVVSCGSLDIKEFNTQRPGKQKRTRQRESKYGFS